MATDDLGRLPRPNLQRVVEEPPPGRVRRTREEVAAERRERALAEGRRPLEDRMVGGVTYDDEES